MKPKLPRKPSSARPPDPRSKAVFQVRYVDVAGQTYTKIFVQQRAAVRFQEWVNRCGGDATVFRAETPSWRCVG